MEFGFGLLVLAAVLLLIFSGVIALVRVSTLRREFNAQIESLTREIQTLRVQFEAVRRGVTVVPPAATTSTAEPKPPPVVPAERTDPVVPQPLPDLYDTQTGERLRPASVPLAAPTSLFTPSSVPPPAPQPATSAADRGKRLLDLEEVLGTNWLNKLGVVILVIGIALFLGYKLPELGPAGKILVGMMVSAILLGSGIWFERLDRWRLLARAGIAGGWALFFFTTYAMYHVPASRVLSSQAVDLVLLFGVGAGMVAHSLRYRSQVTTGLAFLLAFSTVAISQVNVYSLSADGILALGVAIIAWRFAWYELEVFGIVAVYLNHWYWVSKIIEPMQGHKHPFPEFLPSAALLICYWAIFRWSYVIRRIEAPQPQEEPRKEPDEEGERISPEAVSTIASLLNSLLLLGVLKYQAVHPEWAFYALLALGAAEIALGQVPRVRGRRIAFVILSTIGATLLMSAIPFRYTGARMSAIWLFEAEALFLAGVATGEIVFRYLGQAAFIAAAGQMIAYDAAGVAGRRMDGADVAPDWKTGALFVLAAALAYFNARWLPRWRPEKFTARDEPVFKRAAYVAALMLWFAAWIVFPEQWTAVAWSVLALTLVLLARFIEHVDLRVQGNLIAATALARLVLINLQVPEQRWIGVSIVVILFYCLAQWSGLTELFGFAWQSSQLYTWAATLTLAHLAWLELTPAAVVLAWIVLALALSEWGFTAGQFDLRLQAMLGFVLAFGRILLVNLNISPEPGELSARVYTVLPAALAFWYAYWRWEDAPAHDARWQFQRILGFLGSATLLLLIRFELAPDWVAAAWAVMLVALIWISRLLGRRYFLHQALIVSALVLFRAGFYNLYERSYVPAPFWDGRMVCVGAALLLLCVGLALAFSMRQPRPEEGRGAGGRQLLSAISRHPEQTLFFVPFLLLTALLETEVSHGMVTLVWGVEAVAVFVFALYVKERSFRLSGLALLLISVGKIVFYDVWQLEPSDRYLTFIALGVALLAVSWLYTRYRDLVRQYL